MTRATDKGIFLNIFCRAVIVIYDIHVSIKKSCDIHIDTEVWISILNYLSILGQARIVDFFLEAYIMEV